MLLAPLLLASICTAADVYRPPVLLLLYCRLYRLMQGPEIRTGMLENGKPVQLTSGQEVTITTDYAKPGNSGLIAMR
jgi:hypothetical protein